MNRYEDDVPKWQVITVFFAVFLACAAVGFGLFLVTRAYGSGAVYCFIPNGGI